MNKINQNFKTCMRFINLSLLKLKKSKALIETKNAIRDNNKGLYDLKYDMANSVINQIKDIYSKQLEVATKAYDDEYKAYEKMINKSLNLLMMNKLKSHSIKMSVIELKQWIKLEMKLLKEVVTIV